MRSNRPSGVWTKMRSLPRRIIRRAKPLRAPLAIFRLDRTPTLVKAPDSPDIYVVSHGKKRLIPSMWALEAWGYGLAAVGTMTPETLAQIPDVIDSNTTKLNYDLWQNYDWSQRGDEWSVSPEWRQSLIDEVMLRWIELGKTVLEIGPGAGRWTEALQKIAERLTVVDLSDRCIELCKQRFAHCENIEYFVNDGTNLHFIPDETIDFIWSFDVFVHISPKDIAAYLRQFKRILKGGGRAIIHHPAEGGHHGGWRSSMTTEMFANLVRQNGLNLIDQFDSWGNGRFDVRPHHDAISVFEK